MDVNAGRIIQDEATVAEVGRTIFAATCQVAAESLTAAEVQGRQ